MATAARGFLVDGLADSSTGLCGFGGVFSIRFNISSRSASVLEFVMISDEEKVSFYVSLAHAIQAWLRIEQECFIIYRLLMKGANRHLISATFHHITSFDARNGLIDKCLCLKLAEKDPLLTQWKMLRNKMKRENQNRNTIVHCPAAIEVKKGKGSIFIVPSRMDSSALANGMTTWKPPLKDGDDMSKIEVLEAHKLDGVKLRKLEKSFIKMSQEVSDFREALAAHIARVQTHKSEPE